MSTARHDLFGGANRLGDHLVGNGDQVGAELDQVVGGFDEQVRKLIRLIWPNKATQHFSIAADVTVRQAERILAREQGISLAVYRRLLCGEHGERFLWLLMGDATPEWWREIGHERQLTAVKKQMRALERKRGELERGA
jgi:hypothetical protein